MSDYTGRHRPPTRAERRALERRSRLPKSFSPAYALPTAAAATLVLTAAGATAAQSSPFTEEAVSQANVAFITPAADRDHPHAGKGLCLVTALFCGKPASMTVNGWEPRSHRDERPAPSPVR